MEGLDPLPCAAMSSRQEEKEKRRAERVAREKAEAEAAKRKRLAQIVGGVIVAVAVVVGVVLALSGGSSGSGVSFPDQSSKLTASAAAAGCVVKSFPLEGRQHVQPPPGGPALTIANFKTNPPTSGNHYPDPAQDGIYAPGNPPALGNWVHTLEHGRIELQYKPGAPSAERAALTRLFNEGVLGSRSGYHMMLFENNTNMPFAVAGVAWTHYVGCPKYTPKVIEALRAFRDKYVDKGPEQIP